MDTADSHAELKEELRLVEEDLEQLRKPVRELRQRIGARDDEPTDPEERSAMIVLAEEQEALLADLETRREQLLERLGESRHQPQNRSARSPRTSTILDGQLERSVVRPPRWSSWLRCGRRSAEVHGPADGRPHLVLDRGVPHHAGDQVDSVAAQHGMHGRIRVVGTREDARDLRMVDRLGTRARTQPLCHGPDGGLILGAQSRRLSGPRRGPPR